MTALKTIIFLIKNSNRLKNLFNQLCLHKSIPPIENEIGRSENKSFSVAIVGEFERGKSTFINALLGRDILPSNIMPCSATLNRITYGLTPSVKVIFKDGTEEKVAIAQLENYVTKLTEESEEMATNVKEAVVSYPVHYYQNSVNIIDTPGLNDQSSMNSEKSYLLHQCPLHLEIGKKITFQMSSNQI